MKVIIKIIRKILFVLGTIAAPLLVTLSVILYYSIQWMFATWNNLTMEELVFHLRVSLEGTNKDLINEYINTCITPAVLILILTIVLFIVYRKNIKYYIIMFCEMFFSMVVACVVIYSAWC